MRILLVTAEVECAKCREAKAILARVAEQIEGVEIVSMRTSDPEAAVYGIVMSPTVIVENTIIASGRPPNEKKLVAFLQAQQA
ncbi:MAG: thioredoxin family protein [Armatimonadetes bacterium]|nr:thioredoxin family protein [Armatimonadota bacterium]